MNLTDLSLTVLNAIPARSKLQRLKSITGLTRSGRRCLLRLALATICAVTAPAVRAAEATQSSPIALSADDRLLVNVNPEANSITLFDVTSESPRKLAEIKVGREPSSVAINPDGTVAFVANALDGTITPVDLIKRKRGRTVRAGAEPMALAFSPDGSILYVANSASNDVMVFETTGMSAKLVATIDLTGFGTAPRALAISGDGRNVHVAMFYAQLRNGRTQLEEGQDDQREGRVVLIDAETNQIINTPDVTNPVSLSPMANTGFNSNGQLAPGTSNAPAVAMTNPAVFGTPTGAFPNQLASIALHPVSGLAYVVSTGASPNGPLRFTHMVQGLISVYHSATGGELITAQTDLAVRRTAPLNLNQGINLAIVPQPRLFFANPVAMVWRNDGSDAWVVVQSSNALVRLTVDANGTPTIGAPLAAGAGSIVRVDLEDVQEGDVAGKAPRGIVLNSRGSRAYVFNFVSRSISVVDISVPTSPFIVGTARASKQPAPESKAAGVQLGAELFYSGRGPNGRMSADAWGACIVCHPGGRSDNVTWMFEAGPRQTISLDGMFDQKRRRTVHPRILNWSAVRDENADFELNTRGVFSGRGLIEDDRLFLAIGGHAGAGDVDFAEIEQFDQVTASATTNNGLADGAALPELPGGRRDFAVATLDDARVFIIGGRSGPGAGTLITGADAVMEFDPRTNVLRRVGNAGFTPRHSLGAAALRTRAGFRIFAIGGYSGTSDSALPVGTVEEFDPVTNRWRSVAGLITPVAQFGIAVAGGNRVNEPLRIHVVSGNTGTEAAPSLVNPSLVQVFPDTTTGGWLPINPAITPRRLHGAAALLRGVSARVFVVGGLDNGGAILATVEEYRAVDGVAVASPHTAMPAARSRFGISRSLSTNQIYVIGGLDGTAQDTATVFEYTAGTNGPVPGPAGTPSGTWASRGSVFPARSGLQVSSPPGVTNLLPAKSSGRDPRQDAIELWIRQKVRSARAPVSANFASAARGRALFGETGLVTQGASCATCHGGQKWTRSSVDFAPPPPLESVIGAELRETKSQPLLGVLRKVGTFTLAGRVNELRVNPADASVAADPLGANGFNIPSLLSVHETPPYFYSGLAQTLEEVLNGAHDGNDPANRPHFVVDPAKRADLIQFLRSIDANTPAFK
jgi:DNA-binding beta-propeller fold protein YncE